tara:strand:+ start:236 stop:511 length:276 start_codon:yes stop_codon:yes gene_type:complete
MENIQKIFKIEGVREKIFYYKYEILYKDLNKIRNKIINKNLKLEDIRIKKHKDDVSYLNNYKYNMDNEIHKTNIKDWRETAVVLGLYYLLD